MNIKLSILIIFLQFYILSNQPLHAQQVTTIKNPSFQSRKTNAPELTKIVITDKSTILYFSLKKAEKICIPETFFLMDSKSRLRSNFQKAENIAVCKDKLDTRLVTKNFILYFDKLRSETTTFDFKDPFIKDRIFLDWEILGISLSSNTNPDIKIKDLPNESKNETKSVSKNDGREAALLLENKMADIISKDSLETIHPQYLLIDSTLNLLDMLGYKKLSDVDYHLINDKNQQIKSLLNKKGKSISDSSKMYIEMISVRQELFKGLKTKLDELRGQPHNTENSYKISSVQNIVFLLSKEMTQIRTELQRQNNVIQIQNLRIKQKNTILITLYSAILFLIILAFILFGQNKKKRKTNKILSDYNSVINKQKEEITNQLDQIVNINGLLEKNNRNITDSIHAAKRIQDALIPTDIEVHKLFADSFILSKPKNIVSGDFHWVKQVENKVVIAIADCTGHGVPGAIMSILGISLLNELVSTSKLESAAFILNQLRTKVKSSLNQTGMTHEAKEGMDMALCIINLEELYCEFSGANIPLFLLRNKELIEYEADDQPVSVYIKEKEFTNNRITLLKNDQLYMLSDGYVDQFGGTGSKKYKMKNFKELLIKIDDMPFSEKRGFLDKEFEDWRGNNNQLDDVLVMGILI